MISFDILWHGRSSAAGICHIWSEPARVWSPLLSLSSSQGEKARLNSCGRRKPRPTSGSKKDVCPSQSLNYRRCCAARTSLWIDETSSFSLHPTTLYAAYSLENTTLPSTPQYILIPNHGNKRHCARTTTPARPSLPHDSRRIPTYQPATQQQRRDNPRPARADPRYANNPKKTPTTVTD